MTEGKSLNKQSRTMRAISVVERIGNRLPHPWLLFLFITVILLIAAHLLQGTTFDVPGETEEVVIESLLNADGIRYMITNFVPNFTSFPPIGLVIPIVIAVGIGEKAGFFNATISKLVKSVPDKLVTAVFMMVAINGNVMSDASVVIMPAVGAALFQGMGRNPLIGVFSGYAGYLGGLSASFFIAGTDATAAGITEQAAQMLNITADSVVHPAMNWYFMIASTLVLTVVGTLVTEKILAPMLEDVEVTISEDDKQENSLELSADENKGLKYAGISLLIFVGFVLLLTVPENALLRNPETGTILPRSPFISGIVPLVVLLFTTLGIAYGIGAKTIKSSYDIGKFMSAGVSSISSFLVLALFAAQFVDYFKVTGLSQFIALKGADTLNALEFTGIPLIVGVILFSSIINFFIISASAKWTMLAPVLVPMMALLGFSPAFAQAIYRIGDAVTNGITPLGTYLPVLLGFLEKYKKDAGVGTAIAYEIPFAIAFLVSWIILAIIWYLLGLPLGPGAGIYL